MEGIHFTFLLVNKNVFNLTVYSQWKVNTFKLKFQILLVYEDVFSQFDSLFTMRVNSFITEIRVSIYS